MNNVKPDCFAYLSDKDKCKATTNTDCADCRFYKTRTQIAYESEKTHARLVSNGVL